MKTILKIAIILITVNIYGQEKKVVEVQDFDPKYNNITVDGVVYKCLQFKHHEKGKYTDGDSYMKKAIRIKPLGQSFFKENLSLCYWVNKQGKVTVKIQKHPLTTKYIK